jgi:hypothetical protein
MLQSIDGGGLLADKGASVSLCLSIALKKKKKNVKLYPSMQDSKSDMLRAFFSPLQRVCLFRRFEGRATKYLKLSARTMHAAMTRLAATASLCHLLLPAASF